MVLKGLLYSWDIQFFKNDAILLSLVNEYHRLGLLGTYAYYSKW